MRKHIFLSHMINEKEEIVARGKDNNLFLCKNRYYIFFSLNLAYEPFLCKNEF